MFLLEEVGSGKGLVIKGWDPSWTELSLLIWERPQVSHKVISRDVGC